ncbi:MAG: hypothetical protein IJA08_00010 [Clostridia bacterium]|nr:hypothetical protein [Clostridia bacterium]
MVSDALYIPAQKKVVLTTLEPSGTILDVWQVYAPSSVSDLSGNSVAIRSNEKFCATYSDGIDGISIADVTLYDGATLVRKPQGKLALRVCVKIYSESNEAKNAALVIYSDKEEQNAIYEKAVTVSKSGMTEVVLDIPEREYFETDEFFVRIK